MRISTIIAIIITVLLTVVIMQNTDEVNFNLLFTTVHLPKLVVMTGMSVGGFLIGVIAGRPRKVKRVEMYNDDEVDYDEHDNRYHRRPDTLSDEDRDYIS